MKIAIISPWTVSNTAIGGTERFVIDIAESLKQQGNEIDVYMLSGKNYKKNGVNYININILEKDDFVDEEKLKDLFGNFEDETSYIKLANKLEKSIDIRKYDLIQLNSQLFLKAFRTKKRIFTIHTNPFEFEMNFGKKSFELMLKIMQLEYNINTFYVCPSQYYMKKYEELTKLKIHFIPHAIDIDRINKPVSIDQIINKYSLDKNLKHIVLPSRLEPIQKQPMLFMKAFSRIDKSVRKNFQVICTGLDQQYKKYASDIEIFCSKNDINLKILKFDYIYEAYSLADIIILPSKSESFGYSALESLSLGIPTILNSIPTYLEIAKGSKNSYIFKNTEDALILEIKKILKSQINRKKQPEKWNEKYNLNTFGKKYLDLVKR